MQKTRVQCWEIFDDGLHCLDPGRVRQLAKFSAARGVSFSVHGPICDLNTATLNHELSSVVMARLDSSLEQASMLGAKVWILHPGTHGALSWVIPGQDWNVNLDRIRRIQRLGRKLGVEVLVENISAGLAILGRAVDFTRFYRTWNGAPGLALDVGHSHIRGETDLFLRKLGGRIRHVHASDNKGDLDKHLAVGAGSVSWRKVLASLLETGFEGNVVVESVKGPYSSLRRIGSLLRSLQ